MPEGDTVHRIAERLRPLVGATVEAEAPHPRGAVVARAVDGRVLESAEAVGKHLLLHFQGGVTVRSHLRLSGRWRVQPRGAARAGRPWLVLRANGWEATQWHGPVLTLDDGPARRVGPDVLADGVAPAGLVARVRAADGSRAVGEVLLDQRVVSGLGTLWVAESLWQAGVSPHLPATAATDAELAEAFAWARERMRSAVAGSRPLRSVYRRAGRPCPRCGSAIVPGRLGDANRVTYRCPGCQRNEPGGAGAPGPAN